MLFSDNVSLETELALKQYAVERGLLMMGPDCGTAIINGVPLAFANAVRPGKVGIVSAAGTGLQEVSCIIHNLGAGISQAFGTGGRDGKAAIGGLMLLACLQYLIDDPQTEVIVLISKVPDQTVVDKLMQMLQTTAKPVVVNFLKRFELPDLPHVQMAHNLAETGKLAVKLLADVHDRVDAAGATFRNRTLVSLPTRETRRYLRGLFSGGTLSYEAQNIFHEKLDSYTYSNAPLDSQYTLQDAWQSQADTIIDMGADEFTVGRPHPMIDYSLRLKKIEDESRDVECAVILLDVVLGYGAHPAPQIELAETLLTVKKNTCIVVICAVIGTDADPQNRQEVIKALQATGAILTTTNAEACDLAVQLIRQIRSK
jgi:FdrA protein